MTRKLSHRSLEIAMYHLRAERRVGSDFAALRVASLVDRLVRAAASLHRSQEASCNGDICYHSYNRAVARFDRAAALACAELDELTGSRWECERGSGDPRGAAAIIRWDGLGADGGCGDAWGVTGYALPGAPPEVIQ